MFASLLTRSASTLRVNQLTGLRSGRWFSQAPIVAFPESDKTTNSNHIIDSNKPTTNPNTIVRQVTSFSFNVGLLTFGRSYMYNPPYFTEKDDTSSRYDWWICRKNAWNAAIKQYSIRFLGTLGTLDTLRKTNLWQTITKFDKKVYRFAQDCEDDSMTLLYVALTILCFFPTIYLSEYLERYVDVPIAMKIAYFFGPIFALIMAAFELRPSVILLLGIFELSTFIYALIDQEKTLARIRYNRSY